LKNPADKIKRVGLIGHSGKIACTDAVTRAERMIRNAGRQILSDASTAAAARIESTIFPDAASLAREADLLLVFGGDGTLLRAAREIAGSSTPLLGVNIGGLGFLTAVPSDGLSHALKLLWVGKFKFERRALIEASVRREGREIHETALNDVVISRGAISRLIELDVSVDGDPLTRYRCDGLIVSSPTGSTAYSLAAGGALVFPTAEVFSLTPISPHTLTNRSLILPLQAVISIKAISPRPATLLSADGENVTELEAGEVVTIRRSRRSVRLMHLADSSFFEALRRKLHWRGAYL
jgi:NAD+ kinase